MRADAFMPLWVADFMASTATWTGPERGLYLQMLAAEWTSGPLPADTARLARALNYSPAEFGALWPTVRPKFANGGGTLTNPRLEAIRADNAAHRARRSEHAAKASQARWKPTSEQSSEHSPSNAENMPSTSTSISTSIASPLPAREGRGKPRPPPRRRCPADFEVTELAREWARTQAPDVDLQRETAKFMDWEFKTARSDWGAAWRNWMRKAQESAPPAAEVLTWRPPERTDAEEAPEPPP